MPANSGPGSRAGQRVNAFAQWGGTPMLVNGITRLDIRTDYGADGVSGVAATGRFDSGGPSFNTSLGRPTPFVQRFSVTGTTYDSTGAPLASCTVLLLDRSAGRIVGETTSDGSGSFTFTVDSNSPERWGMATNTGVAGATIGPVTYAVA